jgi:hypothetical protein
MNPHDSCIDDHDLECYLLGMATEEAELARIEEHLLWCEECMHEAETLAVYASAIRAGIVAANFRHSQTRLCFGTLWRHIGSGFPAASARGARVKFLETKERPVLAMQVAGAMCLRSRGAVAPAITSGCPTAHLLSR